jgi:hypothetical protein
MANPQELASPRADPQLSMAIAATDLEREMDRLSLVQALRDVEIANGRAIDLTQRLLEANEQILKLQEELRISTLVMRSLRGPIAAFKASYVGRVLRKVRNLLQAMQAKRA